MWIINDIADDENTPEKKKELEHSLDKLQNDLESRVKSSGSDNGKPGKPGPTVCIESVSLCIMYHSMCGSTKLLYKRSVLSMGRGHF